jgi:uncharacterized protein (DUF983 family)
MAMADRPKIGRVLLNGWRKRCARCGEGALYSRGLKVNERCSACNMVLQRDHGDTWMFMIITDRIPMLGGIAAVFFGFQPDDPLRVIGFFLAMALPLLATLRERKGLALALDYLVRVHMPDPSDELHGGTERATHS